MNLWPDLWDVMIVKKIGKIDRMAINKLFKRKIKVIMMIKFIKLKIFIYFF